MVDHPERVGRERREELHEHQELFGRARVSLRRPARVPLALRPARRGGLGLRAFGTRGLLDGLARRALRDGLGGSRLCNVGERRARVGRRGWRRGRRGLLLAYLLARRAVGVKESAVCDFESGLLFAHLFFSRASTRTPSGAARAHVLSLIALSPDGSTAARDAARKPSSRAPRRVRMLRGWLTETLAHLFGREARRAQAPQRERLVTLREPLAALVRDEVAVEVCGRHVAERALQEN